MWYNYYLRLIWDKQTEQKETQIVNKVLTFTTKCSTDEVVLNHEIYLELYLFQLSMIEIRSGTPSVQQQQHQLKSAQRQVCLGSSAFCKEPRWTEPSPWIIRKLFKVFFHRSFFFAVTKVNLTKSCGVFFMKQNLYFLCLTFQFIR